MKKSKRRLFQGLSLHRRASITALGHEARSVPVTLPKISILQSKVDYDDECRTTEASSS
jgi:hypothetical protein